MLALLELEDCQVVLANLGVKALCSSTIEQLLALRVLGGSGDAQDSGLVYKVEELAVGKALELGIGVVLIFHLRHETGAAEFGKDFLLELGEYLAHVADLALAHLGIVIHAEHAENEVLVFDVGRGNGFLEAFPVLAYALNIGSGSAVQVLGNGIPGLLGSVGTLAGELVVALLATLGGRVGDNLHVLDPGTVVLGKLGKFFFVGLEGTSGDLAALDGGGVHIVVDLGLAGLDGGVLVSVFLIVEVAGGVEAVSGEDDAVGNLAAGEGDGLVLVAGNAAELKVALLHAIHIGDGEAFHHGTAVGRDFLVVFAYRGSLIIENGAGCLAAFIYDDGGNGQFGFGGEVCCRIIDGNADGNRVVDNRQNLGHAAYADLG